MTPTRALIEAAEKIEWIIYPDPNIGDVTFCPCCRNEQERGHNKGCQLVWAISSAKAAEEGVEASYRIEGKRYADSQWELITLADPKSYEEAVHLADGWKSESPWYIAFDETRIVSREIRTTVIEVREKEGL